MTKINRYWVEPVKTKKRRNMKYAGKPTKYRRTQLNKELLILFTFCIPFIITTAFLDSTEKIDGIVDAQETPAICDNSGNETGNDRPVSQIPLTDFSTLPYITKLSPVEAEILEIAEQENFKWKTYLLSLACCEGLLDPSTTNTKGNYPAGSRDRGLYGINDYWHSEVPDEVAYDLRLSTIWTIKRINAGYQHEWVCDKFIKGKPNYYHKCLAIK